MGFFDQNVYGAYSQAPDIQGSIERGMQTAQQLKQMQQQQALKNAYQAGVTKNSDGTLSFDANKAQQAMMQVNPQAALAFQKQNEDLTKEKMANDQAKRMQTVNAIAQIAPTIKDQATYTTGLQHLKSMGIDTTGIPEQYDPSLVDRYHAMAINAKDQAELANKNRETDIKQSELGIKSLGERNKERELAMQYFENFGGTPPPGLFNGKSGPTQASAQPGVDPNSPDTDPATLVRMKVPKSHQKEAFNEIETAQNTAQNSKAILDAFDNAAKNKHLVDIVPGTLNADQKQLHALMGPTFKDVEGTVRQAAMDNAFENMTPQAFDSADTTAKKRAALVGYLESKKSAPVNKGFGIDLSQYNSTRTSEPNMPPTKVVGGKTYQKVPGGWQLVETVGSR